MSEAEPVFTQKETVDKPAIIGARWWQESIANEVPRRKAIKNLLLFGGALGVVGLVGYATTRKSPMYPTTMTPSGPDHEFATRAALDMQREFGWSFGATGESLTFDGTSTQPFDRAALSQMAHDLAPKNDAHLPYSVPTLFQAPDAMPKSKPPGDPDAPPVRPLKDVLVPIYTPEMAQAFAEGKALAAILTAAPPARTKDLAVVVDLPGPQAVAFAAGASSALDPVFLFDNWPHPHGVVPAHLTLAAAAYYQPLFAKSGSKPRPMFVLDRKRLATYVDDQSQFDNRYTARMPSVANLTKMGIANILYIGPNAVDRLELDDLIDEFVMASNASMKFHLCPATAFAAETAPLTTPPDAGAPAFFYGASKTANGTFWQDWDRTSEHSPNEVQPYVPKMRTSPYASGVPTGSVEPRRPPSFGLVPVAVAVGTGVILGARASRSGSWNRTTYTSTSS